MSTSTGLTKVVPASESGPCAQCPWRISNQGKRHPDGWYTKKNLRRLWVGLRRGEQMTCHPTDPTNPIPDGARSVPEGTTTKLCAGAEVLVQREAQRCNDLMGAAIDAGGEGNLFKVYKDVHPKGLTKEGAYMVMMQIAGAIWPGEIRRAAVNLYQPDVGHPDLVPWS